MMQTLPMLLLRADFLIKAFWNTWGIGRDNREKSYKYKENDKSVQIGFIVFL
jgi:hypothetical protein